MEGLLQPTHLILILGLALLMFGPKKLPELGQGLGKGIRGFRDALKGIGDGSGTSVSDECPAESNAAPTSPSSQGSQHTT